MKDFQRYGLLGARLAAVAIGVLLILVSCTVANAAESRAKMQIAIVYDLDVPKYESRYDVEHAIEVVGRQLPIDITVYNETVAPIAAHTNPTALTNAVAWYASNQTYSKQVAVTVFLTKRTLGVGSTRFRGFTFLGTAFSSGAAVIQMIGDSYDYQTIAHELAHTLSAPHDDDGACKGAPNSFGFIMQPYASGSEVFSECSLREMKAFMALRSDVFYPLPPITPPPVQNSGGGSVNEFILGVLFGIWACFTIARRR